MKGMGKRLRAAHHPAQACNTNIIGIGARRKQFGPSYWRIHNMFIFEAMKPFWIAMPNQ
jgi:hypothetical protein